MSDIDQLFEQSAELQGDARAEFLNGLTAADRGAVEKLLSAEESLQQHHSFLQGEPDQATLPPQVDPDDHATIPPQVNIEEEVTLAGDHRPAEGSTTNVRYFGEYELLHELARGGMGVVFKARQVNLNRIVALKMILSGQLAGDEEILRFKAEAEAAANLDHPGIVPIFEIGEHDGQHYFSMGFVDGESLQDRVQQPLPPDKAAELSIAICDAVAYAHEKGVIHRDLKPANVLLEKNGQPRITDFGLAKQIQGDSDLTRTGAVMGTPGYMPPEQASGDANVGPLADVYSLGALLYCMLTGRPPFQAANPLDTLMQVLEKEPISPLELNPEIPVDLDTIVLKCLQKSPTQRYSSASELSAELGRFVRGEPIVARPISRLERAWRWAKRRPSLAGLAAAVLVLTTTLAVGGPLAALRQSKLRSEAEELATKNEQLAARNLAIAESESRLRDDAEKLQKIAEDKRAEAEQLAEQNQQQLVASQLMEADRLLVQNDPCGALPHLIEAFRLDGNPDNESLHRTRISTTWNAIPKFAEFWRHAGSVNHIAISRDGTKVATSSHSGKVMLRALPSGLPDQPPVELCPTIDLKEPVWCTAFSPDGRKIATASGSGFAGRVTVFDVSTGTQVAQPIAFPAQPVRVFWETPKQVGAMSIAISGTATLSLFEPGKLIHDDSRTFPLEVEDDPFDLSRFMQAETGRYIQFRGPDMPKTSVRVIDLRDRLEPVRELEHPHEVIFGRLSHDGKTAVTVTSTQVRFWDLATGEVIAESAEQALSASSGLNQMMCGELSFDGRRFIAGLSNEKLLIFDQAGNLQTHPLPLSDTKKRLTAPNGRWIAFEDAIGTIRIYDIVSRSLVACPLPHSSTVRTLQFTPDSRRMVTGCSDGTVRVWDLAAVSSVPYQRYGHNTAPVLAAELSEDETELISRGWGWLQQRDLKTNEVKRLGFPRDAVGVSFHPESDLLAFTTSSHLARVYNRKTGELKEPIKFDRPYIRYVHLSQDGTKIATLAAESGENFQQSMSDGYVHDVETGELILGPLNFAEQNSGGLFANLLGNVMPKLAGVGAIRISPDNERIAYGGAMLRPSDGMFVPQLKMVDLKSKRETVFDLGSGTGILYMDELVFSASGRYFFTTCMDPLDQKNGDFRVWDTETATMRIGPIRHASLGQAEFSSDEQFVAVAADTEVYIYSTQTGKQVGPALRHAHAVTALSLNGDRLTTSTRAPDDLGIPEYKTYVWDVSPQQSRLAQPLLALPESHPFPINHITMLENDRVMICSHFDVRIYQYESNQSWDIDDMQRAATLLTGREMTPRGVVRRPIEELANDWETLAGENRLSLAASRDQISVWYGRLLDDLSVHRDWSTETFHREFQMQSFPEHSFAPGYQGDAYAQNRQIEKALPHYERSYELDPNDGWRMYKLGSALLAAGDRKGFETWSPKFIERFGDTKDASAASNLAKLLLLAQIEPAEESLIASLIERAVATDENNLWFRVTNALYELRSNQLPECEATCGSIIDTASDDRQKALAYCIRGLARQSQNNPGWEKDIAAAKELQPILQRNAYAWFDNSHIAMLLDEST